MAKTCSTDTKEKLKESTKTIEEAKEAPVPQESMGILNFFKRKFDENKTIRRKNDIKIENIYSKIGRGWRFLTQSKLGYMDENFKSLREGDEGKANYSAEKMTILAQAGDHNKTTKEVAIEIRETFSAQEYDENGNVIENSKSTPLNEEEQFTMDDYYTTAHLLELSMDEDPKKLAFQETYIEALNNAEELLTAEEYQASKDLIANKLISIEEDIELEMELYRNRRIKALAAKMKMEIASELQKETKHKDKSLKAIIRNLSPEQVYDIELRAEEEFEMNDIKTEKFRKKAIENAKKKSFAGYLKYEQLPSAWQKIKDNPRIMEVIEKRDLSNEKAFKDNAEAQLDIGNDVSFLNKYDYYVKIIVQDITRGLNTEGATHSPFGIDLSSFTHLKGTTHEILNNLKMSDYLYRVMMAKNTYVAKAKKEILKHNVAKDVSEKIQNEMDLSNQDLNERLADKDADVSDKEKENLAVVINTFNDGPGRIYNDLLIDYTKYNDFRGTQKFTNKNGEQIEGTINQETANAIEIAVENSKNEIINDYKNQKYDDFFEEHKTFNDVKRYLDGKDGSNISSQRLYEFATSIRSSADMGIDKSPALRIIELHKMNERLNSTLFDRNRKFIGEIIKEYTDNGYVLTDQNGNKLGFNHEMQIGSLSMEEFNVNEPTAFADWIAESLFIDSNTNMTTDFLRNDKVMILPEPIARALDEIKYKMDEKTIGPIKKTLQRMTSYSKLGMLYSPTKAFTYNIRNMVYDFYSTLQSQPQAIFDLAKSLGSFATSGINKQSIEDADVFVDLLRAMTGKEYSQALHEFMRHTETMMGISRKELLQELGFNDDVTDMELEQKFNEMQSKLVQSLKLGDGKRASGAKKVVVGYHYFTQGMKWYMGKVTNASQTREFLLRFQVYKSKKAEFKKLYNEETGVLKITNYGAANKTVIRNLIEAGNSATDPEVKEDMYNKAAIKFSNMALVDYGDSGRFVDWVTKIGIPFARFPEGAIKQHYNLMKNFVTRYADIVNDVDASTGKKVANIGLNTLKGTAQTLNAVGIPVLAWNMAMLALAGMDLDDVPEYYEDDGYVVLPPVLKLAGYENIHMLTNTDGFSDLLATVALDDLNTNIQNALARNWYALSDDEKDGDLINDLSDAILSSFDSKKEMFFDAPINKVISMGNPLLKMGPELFTGNDYYPEGPVNVGHKYTFGQNFTRKMFANVGMSTLYTALSEIKGTPRGMTAAKFFGFKSVGTKLDAWNQQRSLAAAYSQDVLGKEPFKSDGYGDDVDYMRDDITNRIKYGDYEGAGDALKEYFEYMQENTDSDEELILAMESLRRSLKNRFSVIPSTSIPQKDLEGYIGTLSQSDINDLRLAYEYQREMLGPFYGWIFGE